MTTKFIELTSEDDDKLLVNVDTIRYIYPTVDGTETYIRFDTNTMVAKENYDTVKRLINKTFWEKPTFERR